jgi:hypothetical protein
LQEKIIEGSGREAVSFLIRFLIGFLFDFFGLFAILRGMKKINKDRNTPLTSPNSSDQKRGVIVHYETKENFLILPWEKTTNISQ